MYHPDFRFLTNKSYQKLQLLHGAIIITSSIIITIIIFFIISVSIIIDSQ